ncbi:MAG: hypothetical protein CVU12_09435 [Bacteroidetes bacterium HGW-Bacteroidetes-7]|jgi:hypothetical protein|nr:MAG: hypothetical protein CVU12_09435 [Bacteroidetes bacterium HGW-Bacteroidetes-7]
MITQIALTVIALYCLFTIYYIYKEDIKRILGQKISTKEDEVKQPKEWLDESGIIGSTKPFLRQKETSADNLTANFQDVRKEDTFTCETKKRFPAVVSREEMEEIFSKQENEPLGIDVETEYPGDQNDEAGFDEDEELMDLTGGIASGLTYEEIIETAATIGKINPSVEEKERAVDVINRAGKTDMFEQVVSTIPESDNRIKKMLEECDEKIKNRQLTLRNSKSATKEITIDFDLGKYL